MQKSVCERLVAAVSSSAVWFSVSARVRGRESNPGVLRNRLMWSSGGWTLIDNHPHWLQSIMVCPDINNCETSHRSWTKHTQPTRRLILKQLLVLVGRQGKWFVYEGICPGVVIWRSLAQWDSDEHNNRTILSTDTIANTVGFFISLTCVSLYNTTVMKQCIWDLLSLLFVVMLKKTNSAAVTFDIDRKHI